MRAVHWLFVVSVALFVCGIGFVVIGARPSRDAAPADAPALTPVASVKQIMGSIVSPGANAVYNAVGSSVTAKGIETIAPKNDEEWATLGNTAAALVEAGNLLLIGDRAVDRGDWVTMTREMMAAGTEVLKATEKKDADAVLNAGSNLNTSCDNCHQKYQRQ
ncbi:MAG: hypothetical protein ABL993_15515 [Vicinamibacterales bacterium]